MKAIVLIFSALLLMPFAESIAVVTDFLEDSTLHLMEGTSTTYGIRLQNRDSTPARVAITYDDSVMKIIDPKDEYTIDPKTTKKIVFNITAPQYKKNSNIFDFSYTVHQLSGGGGSGIPFLTKINKQLKLEVSKHPDRFYIDPLYFVYAAVGLVLLLYVYRKKMIGLWKRRNKTLKNKRFLGSRKFNEFSRIPKSGFKSRKIIKWKG